MLLARAGVGPLTVVLFLVGCTGSASEVIAIDQEAIESTDSAGTDQAGVAAEVAETIRAEGSRSHLRAATPEELAQIEIPGDPRPPEPLPLVSPPHPSVRDDLMAELARGEVGAVVVRVTGVTRTEREIVFSGRTLLPAVDRDTSRNYRAAVGCATPIELQAMRPDDQVLVFVPRGFESDTTSAVSTRALVYGVVGPVVPVDSRLNPMFSWGTEDYTSIVALSTGEAP